MPFGFWLMPGMPWPEALALARRAEAAGFDGIWYADHFIPMEGDLTQPVNESWTAPPPRSLASAWAIWSTATPTGIRRSSRRWRPAST